MFGHDDKPKDDDNHDDGNAVATENEQVFKPNSPSDDSAGRDDSWQPPTTTPKNDDSTQDNHSFGTDDTSAESENLDPAPFHSFNPASSSESSDNSSDDLIDIKQEALGKLSPLIGHLDQTPDEKFRTLMMMIQASDDQDLVKQAYETALKIDDEKTRAQALLDIVNEINYFTQNPKSE